MHLLDAFGVDKSDGVVGNGFAGALAVVPAAETLDPGAIDLTERRLNRCEGRRSKFRLLSC